MKIKSNLQFQTYNDGLCAIYSVENIASPGNMPKQGLVSKFEKVPYEKRTVGVNRYYIAKQADVKIESLIRVPYFYNISPQDICMIGGIQYAIEQVQEVLDSMPESKDISLRKVEEVYELTGI